MSASSEVLGSSENSSVQLFDVNGTQLCSCPDGFARVLYVDISCTKCGAWILFELSKASFEFMVEQVIAATGDGPSCLDGLPSWLGSLTHTKIETPTHQGIDRLEEASLLGREGRIIDHTPYHCFTQPAERCSRGIEEGRRT